jgi:hypothetical protein
LILVVPGRKPPEERLSDPKSATRRGPPGSGKGEKSVLGHHLGEPGGSYLRKQAEMWLVVVWKSVKREEREREWEGGKKREKERERQRE